PDTSSGLNASIARRRMFSVSTFQTGFPSACLRRTWASRGCLRWETTAACTSHAGSLATSWCSGIRMETDAPTRCGRPCGDRCCMASPSTAKRLAVRLRPEQADSHGEPPGEVSAVEWARMSQEPVLMYTAHSAPMQMVFYAGGQFPAEYRGDAFVALHGSWNRRPPSGYEVVRIRFQNGTPVKIEPFLTGFLTSNNGQS